MTRRHGVNYATAWQSAASQIVTRRKARQPRHNGLPIQTVTAKPRKPTKRWTEAERAQQVAEVADMISRAKSPAIIRQYLKDTYGIEEPTAQQRIAAARQVLVNDHLAISRHDKVSELVSLMVRVMDMSIENGRGNDAIGAARLIAELTRVNKD